MVKPLVVTDLHSGKKLFFLKIYLKASGQLTSGKMQCYHLMFLEHTEVILNKSAI